MTRKSILLSVGIDKYILQLHMASHATRLIFFYTCKSCPVEQHSLYGFLQNAALGDKCLATFYLRTFVMPLHS